MEKSKPNRNKRAIKDNSQLNSFLYVQIFSFIAYIVLFFLGCFIALKADIPRKYDYIVSLIIFAVASFLTGYFAGIKLRKNGLLFGVIYALPMNIVIIIISLILGGFTFGINLIITAIVLIAVSGIGGILAVNKRIRR